MFNIFVLVFGAIFFAIILSVFITRKSGVTKESYLLAEEDSKEDIEFRALTLLDLEKLVTLFCEEKSLTIKEKIPDGDSELTIVAESNDPILFGTLVFGCVIPDNERGLTPLATLLEFKDFVKGAGSTKGFLLTGGYFSQDVHQPLEGVKVTLYNRKKIIQTLKEKGALDA